MNTFIPGTAESRYAITFNGDMHLAALDRIHRLYCALWEDQFGTVRNHPISEWDFEYIGDLIYVFNDALFNEIRDMALEMGDGSIRSVEPYLRKAKEAERAIECNKLVDKARDRQREAGTEESREAYKAKVGALAALPDEDAIPLLKAMVEEQQGEPKFARVSAQQPGNSVAATVRIGPAAVDVYTGADVETVATIVRALTVC